MNSSKRDYSFIFERWLLCKQEDLHEEASNHRESKEDDEGQGDADCDEEAGSQNQASQILLQEKGNNGISKAKEKGREC